MERIKMNDQAKEERKKKNDRLNENLNPMIHNCDNGVADKDLNK